MKVNLHIDRGVSFGRNLTEQESKEYTKVLVEAKTITGQTGKSIFIMPSTGLPQPETFNSGIGSLSSKYAQDYFEYMKTYLGFNIVEDLPSGQVEKGKSGFYCAYNGSAFSLANSQINPELLVTKEFENLLTEQDLKDILKGNMGENRADFANFDNVMSNNGMQNKVLYRAFERFEKLPQNNQLKQRFVKYKNENDYWLKFEQHEPNKEFYKFKQFLADEHLKIGKQKLNEKGIKLFGDCLVNFNPDEIKSNPKAFKEGYFMGMPEWRLRSLNFDEIKNETSEAAQLLKKKIQLMAKRYDGIRFDVGWGYVTPVITQQGADRILPENKKYLGDTVLKYIEKWVREVKGENFDLGNLIYEFDAGPDEFSAFKNDGTLIDPLKGRVKIYGSTYMHEYPHDQWGFNEAYLNRGWSPDEYVLGIGNHDPQPLRQIATNTPEKFVNAPEAYHKADAIPPLSRILNISRDVLEIPEEFAKAKWAEPMMARNNQMFFMDVFGRAERFDMQGFNTTVHPEKNYAYKVASDYKTAYMNAIQEGFGFNPMDALEKVFVAKGYDKKHPDLFSKIQHFKDLLLSDEPTPTVKEVFENTAEKMSNETKPDKISKNFNWKKLGLWGGGAAVVAFGLYKLAQKNKTPEKQHVIA